MSSNKKNLSGRSYEVKFFGVSIEMRAEWGSMAELSCRFAQLGSSAHRCTSGRSCAGLHAGYVWLGRGNSFPRRSVNWFCSSTASVCLSEPGGSAEGPG